MNGEKVIYTYTQYTPLDDKTIQLTERMCTAKKKRVAFPTKEDKIYGRQTESSTT